MTDILSIELDNIYKYNKINENERSTRIDLSKHKYLGLLSYMRLSSALKNTKDKFDFLNYENFWFPGSMPQQLLSDNYIVQLEYNDIGKEKVKYALKFINIREQIQERAYQIFKESNGDDHLRNWFQAEKEIISNVFKSN